MQGGALTMIPKPATAVIGKGKLSNGCANSNKYDEKRVSVNSCSSLSTSEGSTSVGSSLTECEIETETDDCDQQDAQQTQVADGRGPGLLKKQCEEDQQNEENQLKTNVNMNHVGTVNLNDVDLNVDFHNNVGTIELVQQPVFGSNCILLMEVVLFESVLLALFAGIVLSGFGFNFNQSQSDSESERQKQKSADQYQQSFKVLAQTAAVIAFTGFVMILTRKFKFISMDWFGFRYQSGLSTPKQNLTSKATSCNVEKQIQINKINEQTYQQKLENIIPSLDEAETCDTQQYEDKKGQKTTSTILKNSDTINETVTTATPQVEQQAPFKIQTLYVYPIKSCAGVKVQSAKVLNTGFEHDREYAICNEETKEMSIDIGSQNENGNTNTETVTETGQVTKIRYSELPLPWVLNGMAFVKPDMPTEKGIWIRTTGKGTGAEGFEQEPIFVPRAQPISQQQQADLHQTSEPISNIRKVKLLEKYFIDAVDQGDEIADYLSKFLTNLKYKTKCSGEQNQSQTQQEQPQKQVRVRLVRILDTKENSDSRTHICPVKKQSQSSYSQPLFGNSTPFHVFSDATLKKVNSFHENEALETSLRRYRPNILIEGATEPWEEDGWEQMEFVQSTSDITIASADADSDKKLSQDQDQESNTLTPATRSSRTTIIILETVKLCRRCMYPWVNPLTSNIDGQVLLKQQQKEGRSSESMMKLCTSNEKMFALLMTKSGLSSLLQFFDSSVSCFKGVLSKLRKVQNAQWSESVFDKQLTVGGAKKVFTGISCRVLQPQLDSSLVLDGNSSDIDIGSGCEDDRSLFVGMGVRIAKHRSDVQQQDQESGLQSEQECR